MDNTSPQTEGDAAPTAPPQEAAIDSNAAPPAMAVVASAPPTGVEPPPAAAVVTPAAPAAAIEPAIPPDETEALQTPAQAPIELKLLRARQRYVIEGLMSGLTHQQAATQANVNVRTIGRWVHHDPAFRAAMESFRQSAAMAARDRLIQFAPAAAEALSAAARRGHVQAAIAVLKAAGALTPPSGAGKGQNEASVSASSTRITGKQGSGTLEMRLRELLLRMTDEDSD